MTDRTMVAPGGFFFLDGDPLGVRASEEHLAWCNDGPLPEWLDGADPDEETPSDVDDCMTAPTLMLPGIPAAAFGDNLTAAIANLKTYRSEIPSDVSVDLPPEETYTRSNQCFVAEAAGVLWAVSLDRICYVSRKSQARAAIDLRSGHRSQKSGDTGIAVTLYCDVVLRFDRGMGPRTVRWMPIGLGDDAPRHAVARASLSGQPLWLFDADALSTK
jgi:hypothetical protein